MLEQPTIKLLWSCLSSVEGENDLRSFERKAMILPQRERDFVLLYFVAVNAKEQRTYQSISRP